MKETVKKLKEHQKQRLAYQHALEMLNYDSQTAAPKMSYVELQGTFAVLNDALYQITASPNLKPMLEEILAHRDEVDHQTVREAEELYKNLKRIQSIPKDEYLAYQNLLSQSEHIWANAKENNDYDAFAPVLEEIIGYERRFAKCYKPDMDPYNVMLDQYEEGLTTEILDSYFDAIRKNLVPLIQKIQKKAPFRSDFAFRSYPIYLQKEFSDYLMDVLTIDKNYCAIAETVHPFTTNFHKHDVRITTHYDEHNFTSNMFSVIHEGGHALYELNTGDELIGSILATGTSMGVHESQSRFFENMIGRSKEFIHLVFPKLKSLFPEQLKDVTEEELFRFVNQSKPSLIRIEADELTYSLHILIRYELEKRLIDGTLSVKDLPGEWNRLYREYLGVEVPNDAQGVLQDVHWAGGSFGYFPSYSIGSAYAAQIYASMEKDLDIPGTIQNGDLSPIVSWLTERIYRFGSLIKPKEVIQNCCHTEFDPHFYIDYLTKKYSALYGIDD